MNYLTLRLSSRQIKNRKCRRYYAQKNKIFASVDRKRLPCQVVLDDPEGFLRNQPKSVRLVLNALVYFSLKCNEVRPSQSLVAQMTGLSRGHVNRIIKKLVSLGFVQSGFRFKRPCFYFLSSFFSSPFVRSRLSHILPAFRAFVFLTLSSLLSQPMIQSNDRENVTLSKYSYKDYIYNNNNNTVGNAMDEYSKRIFGGNPISPKIKEVSKLLSLSKWGQISLSAFPDEAIEHARIIFTASRSYKRNPFMWFCKLCVDYCKSNDINPDWAWRNTLAKAYSMPDNASMVITCREDVRRKEEYERRKSDTRKNSHQEMRLKWSALMATPPQAYQHTLFTETQPPKRQEPKPAKEPVDVEAWKNSPAGKQFMQFIGPEAFAKFCENLLEAP